MPSGLGPENLRIMKMAPASPPGLFLFLGSLHAETE
ncbi:hypothetical protein DFP90_11326 [Aestuariispira insulae]|uniref:Uncharacterized protein n=1 Tax=Aestuariispira insulae TaxID=1461337 RepID=A0A3D9H6Q0_9PROT|nr:hypothetical protein DFP90_11326 [Aestuariispira insulae]